MSGWSDPGLPHTKSLRMGWVGGWGVYRDPHKGGYCGKIESMGNYHYFIAHKVTLIGVSDHCFNKTDPLSPWIYIYISKFYGLNSISYTGFVIVMA